MIDFRLSEHLVKGNKVVEVWLGTRFVATIYAEEPATIRIISKHFEDAAMSSEFVTDVKALDVTFQLPEVVEWRKPPEGKHGD